MVENTPGHLPEQSTKVIKAVAVRNDGFYSEWYSWFTAYGQVEFDETKMPVFNADNDDFTLTLYNLNSWT